MAIGQQLCATEAEGRTWAEFLLSLAPCLRKFALSVSTRKAALAFTARLRCALAEGLSLPSQLARLEICAWDRDMDITDAESALRSLLPSSQVDIR